VEGKPLARRLGGSLVALGLAVLAVVTSPTAALAADRVFSARFQANDFGDINIAANTVLTCPASNATCAAAQGGAASNNNSYVMEYVDVDADPTTFDSSTATLSLPSGVTVLFAGLYWQADTSAGAGGTGAPDPLANDTVSFAAPGGGYVTTVADQLDTSTSQPTRYQGFADVTSTVQAAGSGDYTVAQIQAGTGGDRYGGWALVVAYNDPAQPPRNLTVFDGFQTVGPGNPDVAIPVSGFQTPLSGPVNTTLGFVTGEGDRGLVGDTARLDATTLSDPANPSTNFFNSSISQFGVNVTAKNPNYVNQLGFDADLADASGILANGATSATIHVHTVGDVYFPSVVTFATELYAPNLDVGKTATDVNGGSLEPGDVIEYSVTATNTGQDGSDDTMVTDAIPADTSYVPGSLVIVSSPGGISGAKTDAPGDDQAEFTGSDVVFRVGAGADAVNGGLIGAGESFEVRFQVQIDVPTPDGTTITNEARVDYAGQTQSYSFTTDSPPLDLVVSAPDLVLSKTDSGSFVRGSTATFTLTVSNVGSVATTGTVTVDDTLPSDFVPTGASGTGWSCSISGQSVSCDRSDPLGAGASYPDITIDVDVTQGSADSVTNTATVSGGNDGTTGNNDGSDTVDVTSSADLSIVKTISPDPPVAGDPVTFTLTVTNDGPSNASGVTVTDPLPAQLLSPTVSSSQGSCSIVGGTVTCDLGSVTDGAQATVTIDGTVDPASGGQTMSNSADVSGTEPDPDPSNNNDGVTPVITTSTDLSILKTLDPAIPVAGETATYTLVVTNGGPSDATGVTVTDPLPVQLLSPVATTSQGTCSIVAGILTCDLGSIAAAGQATITVTGTVDPASVGQTMTNTASVTGADPDPDPGDNSSTSSAVVEQTSIAITKTADPTEADAGTDVEFTIDLSVTGPEPATNVEVCDTLPSDMTFVSAPGATFQNGQACWTYASLDPGQTVQLLVVAHIDLDAPSGVEVNLVTYTSDNAGSSTATASVTVTAVGGSPVAVTG
jgi:uncharacterized repeat protein (TIGR01451 family)